MGDSPQTLLHPTAELGSTQSHRTSITAFPSPPDRVGKYQLARQLAGGGMGVVFEALQDEPRRSVALKFMRAGIGSSAAMQRFHDEAQVLARMHHPAIAQVFDAGTHEFNGAAIPYFVMELVPGALAITEYCKLHRLSLAVRVELMVKVCRAVQYGHDNGVIHRDLKPGNIVIDSAGHPRVIDFGIAQTAETNSPTDDATLRSSQLVGTVPYMSPEQCRPESGAVDARSDVYSLGVVMYELLCGRLPYEVGAGDVDRATKIICEQSPTGPSSICSELRGDFEAVLLKALTKDRHHRYTTAAEFADDLERALRHDRVTARGTGLPYRLATWLRRAAVQRMWLVAALSVLLGIVAARAVVLPMIYRIPPLARWCEGWVMSMARFAPAGPVMQDVRIIQITERTDLARIATVESLSGVNVANNRSLRRVHGRLMQRLAAARPRVVTFDIGFPGDTEFDADFVAGVDALRAAGCEVVIGSHVWNPQSPGPQQMSRTIASAVRWGGLSAGISAAAPWRLDLARTGSDGETKPSLALATAAAWREPRATPFIEMEPGWHTLQLRFVRAGDSSSTVASEERPFTGVEHIDGATVATMMLDVPADDVLATASLDYARVFDMKPDELRNTVENRAVLIGDARPIGGDGPFPHPDGRRLPGFFAQATAIDSLLRRAVIVYPNSVERMLILLLASATGAGLALVLGRGRAVWAGLALACVGVAACSVAAYVAIQYLLNPLVPMAALVVAALVMIWAVRERARTALWFTRSLA